MNKAARDEKRKKECYRFRSIMASRAQSRYSQHLSSHCIDSGHRLIDFYEKAETFWKDGIMKLAQTMENKIKRRIRVAK
jgi:hypothetical protein